MNKNIFTRTKPGFILVSVFLMMTVASLLVIQLASRGTIYNIFIPVIYQREQARSLALSGISCALSQLAMQNSAVLNKEAEKKPEKKDGQKDADERKKDFFLTLLMIQNKWHKYEIKEGGFLGECGAYISCEDGKVPLNTLMDFTTQTFITLQKPALFKAQDCLEAVCSKLEESNKEKNAFEKLKNVLKDRKYAFVSVEELLGVEGLKSFKDLLYQPFPSDTKKKAQIYLQDLFTVYGAGPTANPWFFTSSLKLLFDIKEEKKMDLKEYQEIVKGLDFSKTSLSQEWDKSLKKVYNKSYTALPDKIVGLLTAKFEPRFFSVLCYGKVGDVEQRLCAYIERVWTEDTETFKVQKIYWL